MSKLEHQLAANQGEKENPGYIRCQAASLVSVRLCNQLARYKFHRLPCPLQHAKDRESRKPAREQLFMPRQGETVLDGLAGQVQRPWESAVGKAYRHTGGEGPQISSKPTARQIQHASQ